MKSAVYIILTLIKAAVVIYFAGRVYKIWSNKQDPNFKRQAVVHLLYMMAVLVGLTLLEFALPV